jgi:hypothetical protein
VEITDAASAFLSGASRNAARQHAEIERRVDPGGDGRPEGDPGRPVALHEQIGRDRRNHDREDSDPYWSLGVAERVMPRREQLERCLGRNRDCVGRQYRGRDRRLGGPERAGLEQRPDHLRGECAERDRGRQHEVGDPARARRQPALEQARIVGHYVATQLRQGHGRDADPEERHRQDCHELSVSQDGHGALLEQRSELCVDDRGDLVRSRPHDDRYPAADHAVHTGGAQVEAPADASHEPERGRQLHQQLQKAPGERAPR